jgi:two-component system, NtrC family, nitrogen regulation sensor histidine kinase NtrY
MRLRIKFITMVVLLHATALVLTFVIFCEHPLLFILSEAVILLSLVFSWNLYLQLIRPLRLLMDGVDAIKDKDFTVKFRRTGKYEMDQLIDVYNHMIEELRSERTLQEEQHFFLEKLIQTSPTGIIILDYDDQVQQINPKAAEILSIPETARTLPEEVVRPLLDLADGSSRVIKLGGVRTFRLQKSHFMDRGFARRFIMLEELTVELLAAEKNTYGKVIRMMAHEVNNTIGPVNSIIQSVLAEQLLRDPLRQALGAARDRNQNLNLFVRNFAELVKLPPPNKQRVDLHTLLGGVITLMHPSAAERSIRLELDGASFHLSADVQQMEQALVNIIRNAIESIDREGVIHLHVDPSGRRLIIADTGRGISQEDSEHLFSPFYSTKKDGQGIGLTLVREILLQHGFEFSLKTIAVGKTEFNIKM